MATKTKQRENLELRMVDAIETVSTIQCTKCFKMESYHMCDSYDAIEPAINDGWYATELNVYCPTCNKKRKK